MNLTQLRHLIALAETGSFTRAAEAVHLTQPALSRSIQTLEEEMGLCLIDRVGKRCQVSAAGLSVVDRARLIVSEADELRCIGPKLNGGLAGKLGVGLGGGPGAVLTLPLLKHFANHYPKIRLAVSRAPTHLLLESLRERKLDMLVVDARAVPPASDLAIQTLPEMAAGFFCRKAHPLAHRKEVDLAAISSYPIACSPLSNEVSRLFVERFGPKWHPQEFITLDCDDVSSTVAVMLATDAIFCGIAAALREPLTKGEAVCLPIWPAMAKVGRFGMVTLANRSEPPALPLLRKFVLEHLTD